MNKFMNLIGIKARKASEIKVNTKIKNKVLNNYALLLDKKKQSILRQNKKDVKFAENKGLKENFINRLLVDEIKLRGIRNSIQKISNELKLNNFAFVENFLSTESHKHLVDNWPNINYFKYLLQ